MFNRWPVLLGGRPVWLAMARGAEACGGHASVGDYLWGHGGYSAAVPASETFIRYDFSPLEIRYPGRGGVSSFAFRLGNRNSAIGLLTNLLTLEIRALGEMQSTSMVRRRSYDIERDRERIQDGRFYSYHETPFLHIRLEQLDIRDGR
jgi:hypothetical protein